MAEGLFAGLLGQPQAVQLLEASLAQGRLAPAYLFAGPEGVGRALAARPRPPLSATDWIGRRLGWRLLRRPATD